MSTDSNSRPSRGGSRQDLWPKWMWIAVPVLVVVVVAGLWWALLSEPESLIPTPTHTPTMSVIRTQPTQEPTKFNTLTEGEAESTPTTRLLPLQTFTPTRGAVSTPAAAASEPDTEGLQIGAKAKVTGTGGGGLHMRAGAGTGHARTKTLPEGSIVEILGGPKEANGFTWWQVRDETGTTGWVADRWLTEQR